MAPGGIRIRPRLHKREGSRKMESERNWEDKRTSNLWGEDGIGFGACHRRMYGRNQA